MQTPFYPFLSLLQKTAEALPGPEDPGGVAEALAAAAAGLRDAFVEEGDRLVDVEDAHALFLHFELAERVKQLLLLYRDVLFQQLKGQNLVADAKLEEVSLKAHWRESRKILWQAEEELSRWTPDELNTLRPGAGKLAKWQLQNNPWPVYREQLDAICAQCGFLRENAAMVRTGIDAFHRIGDLIRRTLVECTSEIKTLAEQARQTQDWLEKTGDTPAKMANRLEEVNASLMLPHHPEDFARQLETLAAVLPDKTLVAVGTEGGQVQRIDADLRKRTYQWLEGEVLPLLYEVWELTEAAHNDLKLSLSNIRNRVLLLADTKELFQAAQYVQPLLRSQSAIRDFLKQCTELEALIEERLQAHFSLTDLYRLSSPFLPLSVQTTVRQLGLTQSLPLRRALRWLSGRLTFLKNLWRTVEREEQLGFAEKTARYIETRQPDLSNPHYVPIFLTKGFVGASFAVGRETEMAHMEDLVRQWKVGFRGAAIITGARFAGKTFFGEWAASRYFPGKAIRLSVNQTTVVKGRKLPPTSDLGAVLDFLKKFALDDRPLIWIDDLELWQDADILLYENAQALIRFCDLFTTRCFVLVAMDHWTHRQLQIQLGFDRAFQAVLEMGNLSREEMTQGILIRHGATHKKLVQADGQELSPRQVSALLNRVRRAAGGNIGETLQWWTSAIRTYDEDSVLSRFSEDFNQPELPGLPDPETALLLQEILLQKKTDEYRLRRQFGPAFQDRYAHLVRRLLAVGLLERLPDGALEVRESAVNAVADLLHISKT
jgi:hypothetical protein